MKFKQKHILEQMKGYAQAVLDLNMSNFPAEEEHFIGRKSLKMRWNIACASGGTDCDEPEYSCSDYEPQKFASLDKLVLYIAPEISQVTFEKLVQQLVIETTDYSGSDDWGNYTDYGVKKINLVKLFDFLKEENLIQFDKS